MAGTYIGQAQIKDKDDAQHAFEVNDLVSFQSSTGEIRHRVTGYTQVNGEDCLLLEFDPEQPLWRAPARWFKVVGRVEAA